MVGQSWMALAGALALVEAIEQLTRSLDLIATLPSTPALRREAIKLQVALITPEGMLPPKLRPRKSAHVCSSNKRKPSESLPKIPC